MGIKHLSWSRRIVYGMALYTIISVSLGSLYSSTSLGAIREASLPKAYDGPVVEVYAARTWGKKGMLAVHTWIMTRRRGETHYSRHEIIGWKLRWSDSTVGRKSAVSSAACPKQIKGLIKCQITEETGYPVAVISLPSIYWKGIKIHY